ncbi:unnamed protein product [Sphenostylis stenocarpa]|uniref:Uncharacterized protein n=1 Tax=Sphenostylis stenocarpa TaxID=92480 RepID=A0AA86STM6_9FABA|nr:unnamed protein product [Sphenostylis stenocarpa]
MAKSKDDIKYGTAQARLSEDEAVRVAYVNGTPLEGGKISDSQPLHLFASAHNVAKSGHHATKDSNTDNNQSQMQKHEEDEEGSADFTTGAPSDSSHPSLSVTPSLPLRAPN